MLFGYSLNEQTLVDNKLIIDSSQQIASAQEYRLIVNRIERSGENIIEGIAKE